MRNRQKPKAKSQKPKAKSQKPKANSQKPKAKSQKPKAKSQKPKAKSQKPTANSQQPTAKSQQPTAKSQQPTANSQQPTANSQQPMTTPQQLQKRIFDFSIAFLGLLILGWFILLMTFLAYLDTKANGFFTQTRIGKDAKPFKVIKIRTLKAQKKAEEAGFPHNYHLSRYGDFLRKTKLDELPQLWNVLIGDMSIVGPRPDLPGFADQLQGKDRQILNIRPGITGPASIHFKNEEALLATQPDPEKYNREVIWPEKVHLNLQYLQNWSLQKDIGYIFKTVFS